MFRTVLVPLDGTPFAEHAVPTALLLARASGGRLLLARVFAPPPLAESYVDVAPDPRVIALLESDARQYLDDVTARVRAHAGDAVPVEAALVNATPPHVALHDLAAARHVDLVVMESHDRTALGRALSGSVAESLAREPGIPVLIARHRGERAAHGSPDAADPTALPPTPFRQLLVPVDGTATAESVLAPAAALARACGASITLLAVRDPLAAAAGLPGRYAGRGYLEDLAWRLRADGVAVGIRERDDRHPAHAIVRGAAEAGADLIAMGTHGRRLLGRLFQGSVAGEVLHAAHLPVLLLHAAGEGHEAEHAVAGAGVRSSNGEEMPIL